MEKSVKKSSVTDDITAPEYCCLNCPKCDPSCIKCKSCTQCGVCAVNNRRSYTPFLVFLLFIASFALGMLIDKVMYLKGGSPAPVVAQGNQQPAAQAAQPTVPAGPVDVKVGHLPFLGNKDAKVTIIEFADFQCPFCGKLQQEVLPQIIKDYVNTGKAKLYYRHYAFLGQESNDSAVASECANEQGKFWEFHDYLFSHQNGENQGAFSKDNLKKFAATIGGINTDQFNSCLDSNKYADVIAADMKDGQAAGVSGTPAVFVDGQIIVGAQPYTAFQTIIDQELKK